MQDNNSTQTLSDTQISAITGGSTPTIGVGIADVNPPTFSVIVPKEPTYITLAIGEDGGKLPDPLS